MSICASLAFSIGEGGAGGQPGKISSTEEDAVITESILTTSDGFEV